MINLREHLITLSDRDPLMLNLLVAVLTKDHAGNVIADHYLLVKNTKFFFCLSPIFTFLLLFPHKRTLLNPFNLLRPGFHIGGHHTVVIFYDYEIKKVYQTKARVSRGYGKTSVWCCSKNENSCVFQEDKLWT